MYIMLSFLLLQITLMMSGVRSPGTRLGADGKPDPTQSEPYAQEAHYFTESRLLQVGRQLQPGLVQLLLCILDIASFSDADPHGSVRAKMTHINRKMEEISSAGCSLSRTEGYSCSLNVLYGCLGIIATFHQKIFNLF